MKKRVLALLMSGVMVFGLAACSNSENSDGTASKETAEETEERTDVFDDTTITIFAAKSLNGVVDELIGMYQETQPNVEILTNYDSSGTLMEQIKEGATCDLFFSAAQKQMDELEGLELILSDTRANVVNNQVCVVTYAGSETKITGLSDIGNAESFALADGSVPVGKYTRQAMVNAGMLDEVEDVSQITTEEIASKLGVEINECKNVGDVTTQVANGSNEVGTVYKSDTYGLEEQLQILEIVSYDLTGNVIYPIAQIVNADADDLEKEAAFDFLTFLTSDTAKEIYEKYYFDTNVE